MWGQTANSKISKISKGKLRHISSHTLGQHLSSADPSAAYLIRSAARAFLLAQGLLVLLEPHARRAIHPQNALRTTAMPSYKALSPIRDMTAHATIQQRALAPVARKRHLDC